MKKKIVLWNLFSLFLLSTTCLADAPHKVGPFVLDRKISGFKDYVIMETAMFRSNTNGPTLCGASAKHVVESRNNANKFHKIIFFFIRAP